MHENMKSKLDQTLDYSKITISALFPLHYQYKFLPTVENACKCKSGILEMRLASLRP